MGNKSNSEIVYNYNTLNFKLTIPEIVELSTSISITFRFMNKGGGSTTIFDKCAIVDKLRNKYISELDYSRVLPSNGSENIALQINKTNEKTLLSGSIFTFIFLCDNSKKVKVRYELAPNKKLSLNQIEICEYEEKDIGILQKIVDKNSNSIADGNKQNAEYVKQVKDMLKGVKNYYDALRQEIKYLQQGKGKRYKIVNGSKINVDKGIYTYSFELEAELHLPDDAPIVITTSDGITSKGKVLACEDFQIVLLVNRDIGDWVSSSFLMVEPWKLLEALQDKISSIDKSKHKIAYRLINEGPKVSTKKDISEIDRGQDAVSKKLAKQNIVVVWGPPGTGKTHTMANVAIDYKQMIKSLKDINGVNPHSVNPIYVKLIGALQ